MEKKVVFTLFICLVGVGFSNGAIYKVGDSAGWTDQGNVNYTAWAADKTFQVGDIIVFEYNNKLQNVLQVSLDDYRACNSSSPVAVYKSGNDSITMKVSGHHFFICGFPGHCQTGQKVDIRITKSQPPAAPPSDLPPSVQPPQQLTPPPAGRPNEPLVPAPQPSPSSAPVSDRGVGPAFALAAIAMVSVLML
ncbi:mavicyanin-like [Typha latifolia]|uniref:mavicyanin-like n=1 Tax=Typha latifolia TaxID=4733 RepID=UPI003C2D5FA9